MLTPEVLRLIAGSDGVVSRAQLRHLGISDQSIRRQVRGGVWVAEGRSALVAAGVRPSMSVRTRITVVNHPSLIPTGASALALEPNSPWAPFIPAASRPWMIGPRDPQERWLAIAHPGARRVRRAGLWTADDRAALIDLIRFLPPGPAQSVAMLAVQQRRATVGQLRTAAAGLLGYPGIAQLRSAIAALSAGAQSHGEARLIGMLRRAGITGWVANHPVVIRGARYVIDLAFVRQGVAVEFDGWAHHSDPESFVRDRVRQNALLSAGWLVLRFTWADLDDPGLVVGQIQAALRARAA